MLNITIDPGLVDGFRLSVIRSLLSAIEMNSYKDLDIYKMALDLFYKVHPASLLLPKYELYELGSQLRRSSDSIVSNIVEGYGRKRYKADFIRFLVLVILVAWKQKHI